MLNNSPVSRFTLPYINPDYKTAIVQRDILRALSEELRKEEDYDSILQPPWKAPPLHKKFVWNRFFALCTSELRVPLTWENADIMNRCLPPRARRAPPLRTPPPHHLRP